MLNNTTVFPLLEIVYLVAGGNISRLRGCVDYYFKVYEPSVLGLDLMNPIDNVAISD